MVEKNFDDDKWGKDKIKEDLEALKKWVIETIENDLNDATIWDKTTKKVWDKNRAQQAIANLIDEGFTIEDIYDFLEGKNLSLAVRDDYFPKRTAAEKVKDEILSKFDIESHVKLFELEDKEKIEGKKYCIKCWMDDDTWKDITDRRNASFCKKHQKEHRNQYLDQKKKEKPSSARANKKYYDFAKICESSSPDEIKTLIIKRNREQELLQKEYGKIREQIKKGISPDINKKTEIEEKIKQLRTEIKIASQIRIKKMRELGANI